jgi:hypothetical protein
LSPELLTFIEGSIHLVLILLLADISGRSKLDQRANLPVLVSRKTLFSGQTGPRQEAQPKATKQRRRESEANCARQRHELRCAGEDASNENR